MNLNQQFDTATIAAVWNKGVVEPNYASFRKDVCGASMQWSDYGKLTDWGWEIDHIIPVAKGGSDNIANLQPLHWRNNRAKGDTEGRWLCAVWS